MGEEYMADITGNIQVDGLVKQREELERLMMGNPQMEKRVQKLIRKVLMHARSEIGKGIKFDKGDPRQAYKAVKTAVYRQILGGSVSILNKRRAGTQFSNYEPPRTLKAGQRGGNRRPRSQRTADLIHYAGPDRGFVLRFLNAGTQGRAIDFKYDEAREHVHRGSRGGNIKKYGETINTGSRGNIKPRNFFGQLAPSAMNRAAAELEKLIDDMISKEFNK